MKLGRGKGARHSAATSGGRVASSGAQSGRRGKQGGREVQYAGGEDAAHRAHMTLRLVQQLDRDPDTLGHRAASCLPGKIPSKTHTSCFVSWRGSSLHPAEALARGLPPPTTCPSHLGAAP